MGDQGRRVRYAVTAKLHMLSSWSLTAFSITLSPVSVAAFGAVSQERGLSLRFPRFIRLRDDKSTEQASGPDMLVKMWKSQERETKGGADDYDLVDVDFGEEEGSNDEIDEADLE